MMSYETDMIAFLNCIFISEHQHFLLDLYEPFPRCQSIDPFATDLLISLDLLLVYFFDWYYFDQLLSNIVNILVQIVKQPFVFFDGLFLRHFLNTLF